MVRPAEQLRLVCRDCLLDPSEQSTAARKEADPAPAESVAAAEGETEKLRGVGVGGGRFCPSRPGSAFPSAQLQRLRRRTGGF